MPVECFWGPAWTDMLCPDVLCSAILSCLAVNAPCSVDKGQLRKEQDHVRLEQCRELVCLPWTLLQVRFDMRAVLSAQLRELEGQLLEARQSGQALDAARADLEAQVATAREERDAAAAREAGAKAAAADAEARLADQAADAQRQASPRLSLSDVTKHFNTAMAKSGTNHCFPAIPADVGSGCSRSVSRCPMMPTFAHRNLLSHIG